MASSMQEQKLASSQFKLEDLFSVKGYVCLVTGGGSGIGLMMAQALAANGAKVYITSRDMDKLRKTAEVHSKDIPGQIIAVGPCDVSSKDDLEKLYQEIASKEDHLDLLVANAGVSGAKADPSNETDGAKMKEKLWPNETVEDWQSTYAVNVAAVYFSVVAFLPLLSNAVKMRGDFGPSVITTSSMSGEIRHAQAHFSYNASKAATIHLTRMMSSEFASLKIRHNSIAPGYYPSEMTANESDGKNKSELPHEKVQEKGHVPSARPGGDREMASAALFLATNTYVHGQILLVDGGVTDSLAS